MTAPAPERPRQATTAAVLVMVGSAMVVASVFVQLSELHSLAVRQQVQERLRGSGLGVSVDDALEVIRLSSMATAALATATAILGFYALQRSQGARRALTVLAPVLLVAGLFSAAALVAVVVVAVGLLWVSPTREWFDPSLRPRSVESAPPAATGPAPQAWTSAPPPQGDPYGNPYGAPHAAPTPPQGAPWGAPHAPAPTPAARRPQALAWACGLAWGMSAVVATMLALALVVALASPDQLLTEMERQGRALPAGLSSHDLVVAVAVMAGAFVLWCVGAAVVAVLAFRGSPTGRVLLMVSAGLSAGLCLVLLVSTALAVVPLVAAVGCFVLMLRPDVSAWFDAQRARRLSGR